MIGRIPRARRLHSEWLADVRAGWAARGPKGWVELKREYLVLIAAVLRGSREHERLKKEAYSKPCANSVWKFKSLITGILKASSAISAFSNLTRLGDRDSTAYRQHRLQQCSVPYAANNHNLISLMSGLPHPHRLSSRYTAFPDSPCSTSRKVPTAPPSQWQRSGLAHPAESANVC